MLTCASKFAIWWTSYTRLKLTSLERRRFESFFAIFGNRVINVWNSLPLSVVDFSSFSKFRKSLFCPNICFVSCLDNLRITPHVRYRPRVYHFFYNHFWPTVLSVAPLVQYVCRLSVTFCILAKRLDRFAWNFQGKCGVTMGRPD